MFSCQSKCLWSWFRMGCKKCKESGVKWFAVASVGEGIQVKTVYGESRVLLLAEPSKNQLENVKVTI